MRFTDAVDSSFTSTDHRVVPTRVLAENAAGVEPVAAQSFPAAVLAAIPMLAVQAQGGSAVRQRAPHRKAAVQENIAARPISDRTLVAMRADAVVSYSIGLVTVGFYVGALVLWLRLCLSL